jgi:hypothetical protein
MSPAIIEIASQFWYKSKNIDDQCAAELRLKSGESLPDWQELDDQFEERAAIMEFDGGLSRYDAENRAAQQCGFENKAALKVFVQALKAIGG